MREVRGADTAEEISGEDGAQRAAGPLAGIRILDLTSVLFGPYATFVLGQMGADIIKVESPAGDVLRIIGPSRHPGMSAIFLAVGRSKRSVVIDLSDPRGRQVLLELATGADVFVHSLRPQAISKLRLTYADVSAVRRDIVYCNAAGFGRNGRYAGRPAYDDVIQGATGFAAAQANVAGEPQYVASPIADKTTGLAAAAAILAALYHRATTGEGQELEVPMFETMASYFLVEHLYGETFSPPIGEACYPRLISRFRRPYRTSDGYLCVMVYNDKQWLRFFDLIGRADLLQDARFNTMTARTDNVDLLYQMLDSELRKRASAEWLALLQRAEIPVQPLADVEMLLADPHLDDVGFLQHVDHPSEGAIRTTAFPLRFGSGPAHDGPAPRLGEHTAEILLGSGVPHDEVEQLAREGVILCASMLA